MVAGRKIKIDEVVHLLKASSVMRKALIGSLSQGIVLLQSILCVVAMATEKNVLNFQNSWCFLLLARGDNVLIY